MSVTSTVCAGNRDLGDEGAFAVADTLTVNKTITRLNLAGARARPMQQRYFANLGCAGTTIGEVGLAALSNALKLNTTVTSVDFEGVLGRARACTATANSDHSLSARQQTTNTATSEQPHYRRH